MLHTIEHLFTLKSSTLYAVAAVAAAYAVLEGVEAVGLWYQKRWAEYLTFVATIAFLPYEVYELTKTVSALKIVALVVNLAIASISCARSDCSGSAAGLRPRRSSVHATPAGRRSSGRRRWS